MEISNSWYNGFGSPNGVKTIVRVREHLKNAFDSDVYKNRIEINWNYSGDEKGQPNPELLETISQTEKLLYSIENEEHSIHLITITGNNCVTWIWCSKSETIFMNSLHNTLLSTNKLPIEILFEYDPEWEYYLEVLENCGLELD